MSTQIPANNFAFTDSGLLSAIEEHTTIRDKANEIARDCPSEDVRAIILEGVARHSHILSGLHTERIRRGIELEGAVA